MGIVCTIKGAGPWWWQTQDSNLSKTSPINPGRRYETTLRTNSERGNGSVSEPHPKLRLHSVVNMKTHTDQVGDPKRLSTTPPVEGGTHSKLRLGDKFTGPRVQSQQRKQTLRNNVHRGKDAPRNPSLNSDRHLRPVDPWVRSTFKGDTKTLTGRTETSTEYDNRPWRRPSLCLDGCHRSMTSDTRYGGKEKKIDLGPLDWCGNRGRKGHLTLTLPERLL